MMLTVRNAFSLIEALVATVIVGVGLVATLSVMKVVNQSREVSADRSAYQVIGDAILQNNRMLVRSYPSTSFPVTAANNFIAVSSTACPVGSSGTLQSDVQATVCNLKWPTATSPHDVRVLYSVLCGGARVCGADSPRSIRVIVEFRNRSTSRIYERVAFFSR